MKKNHFYYLIILLILIFSQISIQAATTDCVTFNESIDIDSAFEWVIDKYTVEAKPHPDNHTFFKEGDVIKAKIIAEPPTELQAWDSYTPCYYNSSDWIQYYKNDEAFDINQTGFIAVLFHFGLIYPISWKEDITISYFEQYATIAENEFAFSLNDYKLTTNLGSDYFKIKYDFTCRKCIGKTLNYRIYNIHTGIISKFQYMYNNEVNDIATHHYEIILVNPGDEVAPFPSLIPIVAFLVIGLVKVIRRKKKKI